MVLTQAQMTESNTLMDVGQVSLLTAYPSGGTMPYYYEWHTNYGETADCASNGNVMAGASAPTYLASPTTTNSYAIKVTDSATTSTSYCSTNTITVNPAMTTPTLVLSNTFIDQGQSILFTANTVSGQGTPRYSFAYNVYAFNAQLGQRELIANNLYTGNSYTSNSWLWTPSGDLYLGNTLFNANVAITDSSPAGVTTVNSVYSPMGYNSAISEVFLTSSNALVDQAQYETFTYQISGGTAPYTYNFMVTNMLNGNVIANQIFTGCTPTTGTFTTIMPFLDPYDNDDLGLELVTGNVIDSATTTTGLISVNTISVSTTPILIVNVTASNGTSTNIITYGSDPVSINALVVGGTVPFIFKWTLDNINAENTTFSIARSYSTLALPAVGVYQYNVIAVDSATTKAIAPAANTLTITKNNTLSRSTLSVLPSYSVGYYTLANVTFNGIGTIRNQSPWYAYVNGRLSGVFASRFSWYEQASPGVYNFLFTNAGGANYTNYTVAATLVVQSIGSQGIPIVGPTPIIASFPPVPQVSFTSLPVYTSVFTGGNYTSLLAIKDTGQKPEQVNLSISPAFANVITLSSNMLYLQPNQSLGTDLAIRPEYNLPPGTYAVPINIRITSGSNTTAQTRFLTLSIYSLASGQPGILNQISILNYTNSTGELTSGTIEISSPINASLANATFETVLPGSLASNASAISTFGIPSRISLLNGSYIISWQISYLPANQTVYAYYTIQSPGNQPQSQAPLSKIQTLFTTPPTQQAQQLKDILKVVNVSIPTFYTGSVNYLNISALYVAKTSSRVNFTLSAPAGTNIADPSRILNATPNQYLSQQFAITTKSAGTLLLTLYLTADNASATYSLPVVVVQGSTPPRLPQLTQQESQFGIYVEYAGIAIILIALATASYILIRRRSARPSPSKLSKSRERSELQAIKEQIGGDVIIPESDDGHEENELPLNGDTTESENENKQAEEEPLNIDTIASGKDSGHAEDEP